MPRVIACDTVAAAVRALTRPHGTEPGAPPTPTGAPPPALAHALAHWSLEWSPTVVGDGAAWGRYDAWRVDGGDGAAAATVTLAAAVAASTDHGRAVAGLVRAARIVRAAGPWSVDAVLVRAEPGGVRRVPVGSA